MSYAIQPTSTVSNSGFSLTGDSDVHLCIDDGVDTPDDNTTCVESNDKEDYFEVGLDTPPFTPVVGPGHTLRVRTRVYSIGFDDGEMVVEFYNGGSIGGDLVYQSDTIALNSTFTDYDLDIGLSDPLSDYSDLSVVLRDVGPVGSHRIRITALELVIPSEFPIDGSSPGSSSLSVTAGGLGALSGLSSGSSATSATCAALGALSGSSASSSQVAGVLSGSGELEASAEGSSTVSGTGSLGSFSTGTASGSSTVVAAIQGLGALLGEIAGASSLVGLLIDSSGLGPYELISNAVRLRFQQQVALPGSLPVAWDNAPFAAPTQTTWARVSVRVGEARQIAFGTTNDYRKTGELVVSFFTPLGTGDQSALALADSVKSAFRLVRVDPVTFGVPSVRPGLRDGSFWRVDVVVPFESDFTISRVSGSPISNPLTFEEVANIARSRFEDVAEDTLSLNVIYDDEPTAAPSVDATFVRCSVLQGESAIVGLGAARTYRTQGYVMAAIYVPLQTGEKTGLSTADTIADHFRAVTDRGVTFKAPLVRSVEREGAWWRISVVCPFQWDEVS